MARSIAYWPDDTWCDRHQLDEYAWKSDDYKIVEVDDAMNNYSVDDYVHTLNRISSAG